MILAGFFLFLSVVAYALSQLVQHGKFKWMSKDRYGFFGEDSDKRKYKNFDKNQGERWPTSTWLTVAFTDFYHASQSVSFICLSLSISILSNVSFWYVWPFILLVNSLTYKMLSR